ncbi:hypothetical protein NH8B_2324 [Pseudogulbenkiania sp. NH8B]|uniref:hypothetical protein n=1 Tax=Pseudogulbenkiania sp. (strain NH8B) TaxID=748280 RepID=UPI0002279E7E|nr:hypothetical protein [Pseudogulbenkiania sp. NH8B]BAK77138.1 hypothetical protein NH8B_2324 [Pseudogulbenkiania sp. NH8B]
MPHLPQPLSRLLPLCLCSLLLACSSPPGKKPVGSDGFSVEQLGQSDGNRVANLTMRDNLDSLSLLLDKLYKRNPSSWRAGGAGSRDEAHRQIMEAIRRNQPLPALGKVRSVAALTTAFDPHFKGDRAGTLIYGLGSMLLDCYDGKTEHYLLDGLDAGKLANASYNVEVAAWLLSNRKGDDGKAMLRANELSDSEQNLSFEREFGKIVGRLDLLAAFSDEKYRRAAINYSQALLGAPLLQFLPLDAAAATAATRP